MQNFPVQRRSDRGYSSDIDSMRSNRPGGGANQSNQGGSGMRGRGRGGRGSNPRYHPGNNLHNNSDPSSFNNFAEEGSAPRPKYPSGARRGGGGGGGRGNGSIADGNGRLHPPARGRPSRPPSATTPKQ